MQKLMQNKLLVLVGVAVLGIFLFILFIPLPKPTSQEKPPVQDNFQGAPAKPEKVEYEINGSKLSNNPQHEPSEETLFKKTKLISQDLPEHNQKFSIEYLTDRDVFLITINESPLEENTKEALDWLNTYGFTNSELEALKIEFTHPNFVN